MKHIFHLTFALLAGMALCACSSDDPMDNDQAAVPVQPGEAGSDDTWSVKIEGDMTRSLTLSGSTLTPKFNGEYIYVYYGDTKVGTLTAPSGNVIGDQVLTGRLNNVVSYTAGQDLSLYFLKDKGFSTYTGQKGTIADIAANFDFATATAQITNVDVNTHTLTISKATFTSQQAIACFKFDYYLNKDDEIIISGGSSASVKLTAGLSAGSTMYVALPLSGNSSRTFTFNIKRTVDTASRTVLKGSFSTPSGKTMQNGKYYSTVNSVTTTSKHMYFAVADDKQKRIGSDGFIYGSDAAATNAGTNVAGVLLCITAKGNSATNASGIVLSKSNGPRIEWVNINQTQLNKNQNTKPVGGSNWKLPTMAQWNSMLQNITGENHELDSNSHSTYSNVSPGGGATKLGGSDTSDYKWIYWHDESGTGAIYCYRATTGQGCLTGSAQNRTKTGDGYKNFVRPISTF